MRKMSLKNDLSDTSSEESDGGVRCNRRAGSSGGARRSKNGEGKQDEERDEGESRCATGLHDGQCRCSSTLFQGQGRVRMSGSDDV